MTSRFVPPRNAALDDKGRDRHSGPNGAPTAVVLYEVTPSDEIRVRSLNETACRALRLSALAPLPRNLRELGLPQDECAAYEKRLLNAARGGRGFTLLRETPGPEEKDARMPRLVTVEPLPAEAAESALLLEASVPAPTRRPASAEPDALCAFLSPALCSRAVADLTEDRVECAQVEGRALDLSAVTLRSCEFLDLWTNKVFGNEARRVLKEELAPERLAARYEGTPRWLCEPFSLVEEDGRIAAATLYVLLAPEANGHLCARFYQLRSEKAPPVASLLRLPKTLRDEEGLCKPGEDRHAAETHLAHASHPSAFALIRIHPVSGDRSKETLSFISASFGLFFASRGIASRSSEDSIRIFLPDCASAAEARKTLEKAFLFVRRSLEILPDTNVRFAGVFAQGEFDPLRLEAFRRDAPDALEGLARENDDVLECVRPEILAARTEALRSWELADAARIGEDRHERAVATALSPEENALFHSCLDRLIRAPRPAAGLEAVLAALGRHYGAARVYALRFSVDDRTIEDALEWTGEGKPAIRPALIGRETRKFPLLTRALASRRPAFLKSAKRNGDASSPGDADRSWTYAIVPCEGAEKSPAVLLVIDGPEDRCEDRALPVALSPYIALCDERMLKARRDELLRLEAGPSVIRSPAAVHDALATLTSEHYVTMGALVAALPQALRIVNEHGIEHFSSLLQAIEAKLRQTFANAVLIHLLDMEFALLVPNVTKEAFFERADAVKRFCSETFRGQVATGATWSRGVFSGANLLKEARTIALSQASGSAPSDIHPSLTGAPRFSTKTIADFTVHYQPKFDMRTGRICGAEALVRGLDERGNLISPAHFIPQMEKSGALRELDLFVLSRVLWQMNDWKRRGLPLVPVAVNFSRFTVIDHSALGAVLAVLSHYEGIDPSLIEIEITETACGIEKDTLEHTLRPYRDLGLRFALDDFGTGYSNLSIFSKLHFDTVKIDRSLIVDVVGNPVSRSLIESIVGISRERNVTVVVEGVETEAQAQVLLNQKCFVAQGNFYERPLPSEEFAAKYLQNATINARSTFGE